MLSFDDQVPALDNAVSKDILFRVPNWAVAYAADDTSHVIPILREATNILLRKELTQPSASDVEAAMCDAYSRILSGHVAREYLTKFGLGSVDDFKIAGASALGRRLFWSLSRKIDKTSLGVDLLVYGFDYTNNRRPNLFHITNPGNSSELNHLSAFAVGAGTRMAMASLHLRPLDISTVPNGSTLVYRLCEAKFSSETASSVGKATSGYWMTNDGHSGPILEMTLNKYRNIWETWRRQPPPEEALNLMTEFHSRPP